MAGDWIKVEHVTPDKPEVHRMADILKLDPDAVMGKLLRIWIWADQQTYDGTLFSSESISNNGSNDCISNSCNAVSVTKSLLDRITCVTGFADAMLEVGWLHCRNNRYSFPHFSRHNGKTAKRRAQTSKRVESHRSCNADVTLPALQERYKSVTREEKRREEKNNTHPQPLPISQEESADSSQTSDFDNTPQGLAQLWCFHLKRLKYRSPADLPEDIAPQIEELLKLGPTPEELHTEILRPERDKAEYFWKFKERLLDARGSNGKHTPETHSERVRRIGEEMRQKEQQRRQGGNP